nr:hypothetical protein [Tanacetum cinerariifolium]
MAAYGWKVRTSPRRVDPGAPASGPLLTGSSLLAAPSKAREDNERHQESRQERPDQIMLQHLTLAWMNFMIIRSPSLYNEAIGRPGVRRIQAVPIIQIECAMVSGSGAQQPVIDQVTEEKIQVAIHLEYLEQAIAIGSTLTEEGHKELCELLKRNLDIFAWKPTDMTGAPERNKAIYEEVEKLVDAGIMKEVYYHSWLSNPIMVKKHDGSLRMCVDFKDLNKACLKDGYPLPEGNGYDKMDKIQAKPDKTKHKTESVE